jgi:hypothetical protein
MNSAGEPDEGLQKTGGAKPPDARVCTGAHPWDHWTKRLGKVMLLRMICGIAVPTEGEIFLDGKPVSAKGIACFPADIGIVIENTCFIAQASG